MAGKLPDAYQIVLVGLSEKQIRRLPDQIIGIRKTDSVKELAELYTAAHVFVNLTYEDNYPTTNLEALVRAVLAVPEPGHQRALFQCDERQ